MAPPATAVVPIGEALLIEGLKRRFTKADFYASTTRPPSVYRGNPFVVEVGLAYGGDLPLDEPADIMRFANRVPLQYQPKACAISESVYQTNWRGYELQQPKGGLPVAPLAIAVHLASVWVPFTSEAKEAVAHYDELLREMKLAIQECGRKLAAHLRARAHARARAKRRSLFEKYIPEVAQSISRHPRRAEGQGREVVLRGAPELRALRRRRRRRRRRTASRRAAGAARRPRRSPSAASPKEQARSPATATPPGQAARPRASAPSPRRPASAASSSRSWSKSWPPRRRVKKKNDVDANTLVEDREARASDAGRGDQGQEPRARHPHARRSRT